MHPVVKSFLLTSLCFLVFCSIALAEDLSTEKLSANDYSALKVCEGIIQLFKQFPDSVWPGYNLAQRPFILYMPGKWVLLFNYSGEVEGFIPYPKDWPDLGTNVLYHQGTYKDLAGQLVFDLPIDTFKVAAIPFMGKSEIEPFAFIVHEAFHQYQGSAFGEIPWEREEKYPIQDSQNTALAYLEMRLLMDALNMSKQGETKKCQNYLKQFVAVRDYRWMKEDPFIRRYEQGQEINEGTAKYVELKSIDLTKQLQYKSSLQGLTSSLPEDFSTISMPGYLLGDFRERMSGNSISPEDMPRNRIYPVGAAQGFLLDYFKLDWKRKAQEAGPKFNFAQLFSDYLGVKKSQLEKLLKKAKKNYGYEQALASTDRLIQEYLAGFNQELESFESQPGYRIEISLSSNNLSRSRSSSAKNWIVDKGARQLRNHYNVYVLKRDSLLLQLHDLGIFEQNNWDVKLKKVVFFVPEMDSIWLDGELLKPAGAGQHQFKKIEILENNLKLNCSCEGSIEISDHRVKIKLP